MSNEASQSNTDGGVEQCKDDIFVLDSPKAPWVASGRDDAKVGNDKPRVKWMISAIEEGLSTRANGKFIPAIGYGYRSLMSRYASANIPDGLSAR
jgi:hypothetical protein